MSADAKNPTRRGFIKGAGLVAAAAMLPRPAGAIAAPSSSVTDQIVYSEQMWGSQIGKTFQIASPRVTLTLKRVTHLTPATPTGQCFALRFEGPPSPALGDGKYTMSNSRLGTFPMFLTVAGSSGASRGYSAIINRL